MKSLLFSIIIPIYNIELYIHQCIDSVLNQTYKNFELILVDDGSPDNCPSICDEYACCDDRVKVIHKKNGGLVSARKAGANIACGDYIVCVDGDDWIENDYIEKMAKIAIGYEADIIACGYIKAYENKNEKKIIPYRKGFYTRENIVNELFPTLIQGEKAQYFPPSIWAKAYKSELYIPLQNAVDDKIKIGEDGACVIPCIYNAKSIFIMEEFVYYYRQNPSSMTKEHKAFDLAGPKLISEHLTENMNMNEYDFQSQLYLKITHELFSVLLSQFNRKEKYKNIKCDIEHWLEYPLYNQAVQEASFKGIKGRIASLLMRRRLYRIMQLINYIRRFK